MQFFSFIAGIIIGTIAGYFFRARRATGEMNLENERRRREAEERLEKTLRLAREKGEISNDDVEGALEIGDATATRYLSELVKRGLLERTGDQGRGVKYQVK